VRLASFVGAFSAREHKRSYSTITSTVVNHQDSALNSLEALVY
jgi:hypothetical protein